MEICVIEKVARDLVGVVEVHKFCAKQRTEIRTVSVVSIDLE